MVRPRAHAGFRQPRGKRIDFPPRGAVDDPGLPSAPGHDVEDLPLQARAREHAIDEVGPIERSDELDRILELELRGDVATHPRRRRRRVGMEADAGKDAAQPAELPVLGTEVVPPLADAVRLVDGNELHVALRQSRQKPVAAVAREPLRRDIEQSVATFAQAGRHRRLLVGAERAVVERCRHAVADERIDLILHQGDERRDDHTQSRPHQRRRLEAERLASAGRAARRPNRGGRGWHPSPDAEGDETRCSPSSAREHDSGRRSRHPGESGWETLRRPR